MNSVSKDVEIKGFWQRYNSLLKTLGFTKKDISARTDISYMYLINCEHNGRFPRVEDILKLAKLLDTTVEWLLTGEEPEITQEMISKIVVRTVAAAKVEQELADPVMREIRNNSTLRTIVEYYISKGQRYIEAQGMVLGLTSPPSEKVGAS